MTPYDEAIQVLSTRHRRLASRLACAITERKQELSRLPDDQNDPLASHPDLSAMARGLRDLRSAIDALKHEGAPGAPALSKPRSNGAAPGHPLEWAFDGFIHLVRRNRHEEAAQELSRILRMPLDRAITATHFFKRAANAGPDCLPRLSRLCENLETASASECLRVLSKTFGFQAVEARLAVQALLTGEPFQNALPAVAGDEAPSSRRSGISRATIACGVAS